MTPTIEITLHPKQLEFYKAKATYRGFVGGIGSGKSFIGAFDIITKSIPGALHAVVAPTYRLLQDATQRSFIHVASMLGLWNEESFKQVANTCILNNGAEFIFRSGTDPGRLRGPNLYAAWLDECSQMSEEVFLVMIGRLRHGGKQGWLTGTFTPSDKSHWTHKVFCDTSNPNVFLVHCSTKDNPFIDRTFYETLKLQYGKGSGGSLRALRELEGQFVSIDGSEWDQSCFEESLWFDDWPNDPDAIRVVMLDSSRGVGGKLGDYSVFAMVMYSSGLLWVEFDLSNTRNTDKLTDDAVRIQQNFRPHFFGIEAELGGESIAQQIAMKAEAANVLFAPVLVPTNSVSKSSRIYRLTPYMSRRMFRWRRTEQTRVGVEMMETWPYSQHDDAPDALEGAIRIINESGLITPS